MKTIEEAAKEYQVKIYTDVYEESSLAEQQLQCINDFNAGIEFAQRWIPIEEELPKLTGESYQVICKRKDGGYLVNRVFNEIDVIYIKNFYTHWRLIELK